MTNYQQQYEDKLTTLEEAAKHIKSGHKIVSNPITGFPSELVDAILDRHTELEDVRLVSLFALKPYRFLTDPEVASKIHYETMFMGPLERKFYQHGLFDVNSVNFSYMARHVVERVQPDVFVAQVTEMDDEGYFNLGNLGVAIGRESFDAADFRMVQVNKNLIPVNRNEEKSTSAEHVVHISEVDVVVEADAPLLTIPSSSPTEIEEKLASYVVPYIKDNSILQIGFGGLANAVSYGLIGKVTGLGVHTEMITESMMDLAKEGVITQEILGGFSLGSEDLYKFTGENELVRLQKLTEVNDSSIIGQHNNFVSINATLSVDLTGQIASEGIGTRQVSSTGGAGDFVRGATKSKGGQSFVCVTSSYTDKDGNLHSNVVPFLPPATPVTVPRQDIMYIVTEYGVADIFNLPIAERARRIIEVAHPDFREELTQKAKEAGYFN